MDGAWKKSLPVLGNVLDLLTPNFHRCGGSRLVLNRQMQLAMPAASTSRPSGQLRAAQGEAAY